MPQWVKDLWAVAIALQGLWGLTTAWWQRGDSEPTRILDWGPQPNRIRKITSGIVVALSSLSMGYQMAIAGKASWIEDIGYVVFMASMVLCHVISLMQHLGLYESGMRVLTRFLFGKGPRFIKWSTIKRYQWKEQGTLLINPGWNPITCLIPEDHIADVDAVLKAKCPEGELRV